MTRRFYIYGGIASAALLLIFLYAARSVMVPFLLALLLAYFLDPAADALEKRRLSRTVSVLVVFFGFLLIGILLLILLIPSLRREFATIQQLLPSYAEAVSRHLPKELIDLIGLKSTGDFRNVLESFVGGIRNLSMDVVRQILLFLSKAFSSTFNFVLVILGYFIIPLYLFYLLRDFDRIRDVFIRLIPIRYRDGFLSMTGEIDEVLGGFIRGQLSVCLILAVLYSTGLLVIGIDLALVIGIFSGLAFIIPYAGTILGGVFAVFMALVKFGDILHPLLVLGWFTVVQGVEGAFLTPRIVGDRVGLHPVTTLLAVLTGGELFGFIGLLLAVPVAATTRVLLRHAVNYYFTTPYYLEKRMEPKDG